MYRPGPPAGFNFASESRCAICHIQKLTTSTALAAKRNAAGSRALTLIKGVHGAWRTAHTLFMAGPV